MKLAAFFRINISMYSPSLWGLLLMSISLQAQIATQPLFMQIKAPILESSTGIQIDPYGNIYHINSLQKDSVDISFLISVPKEMLSEKWAISLTPSVFSKYQNGRLKDVVIKGWKFAEMQEENYSKYDNYLESIIDSSAYEKQYIDQKRLEQEIEHRHDVYWQFYYDEWERQVDYEIWKSTQDGSIQTYSRSKQSAYNEQLYNQYLLRIENQSKRYLKAGMDTAGLHSKYITEYQIHTTKMPRYFVNKDIPLNKIPKRFKDIHSSGRTLQDITDSMLELLVRRDSALMALPVLDYGRIVENEKKTIRQHTIHNDIIQLPKNENALLDTTIYDTRSDYRYLYTYRYPVPEGARDTIRVQLRSKILATDGSGYSSNSEDTLFFVISPTPLKKVVQTTKVPPLKEDKKEDKIEKQPEFLPKENEREKELLRKLSERLEQLEFEDD